MPDSNAPGSGGENLNTDKVKYTVTEIKDGKITVKDESGSTSVLETDENTEYKFYRPDGGEGGNNPPEMQNGEMPGGPNGGEGGSNPPQMPDGEMPGGPNGGDGGGNSPQGNPPEKPEGTPGADSMPQMPEDMKSPSLDSISAGDVIYVVTDNSGKVSVIEIEMTSFGQPHSK